MHSPHDALERIGRLIEVVAATSGPALACAVRAHHVEGEPIPYREARRRPYSPFRVGEPWGAMWGTTWFHVTATVPVAMAGGPVVLRFGSHWQATGDRAGEALLWRDDIPLVGMSSEHPEAVLITEARGGEEVDLWVEAAANPVYPHQWAGVDWPLFTPGGEARLVLSRCEIAARSPEAYALLADLRCVAGLAEHGTAQESALAALEAAAGLVDPDDVVGTAPAARAALAATLAEPAPAGGHRVSAVGHAHIDTAWLWPLRETERKCARTFATAVTLMDDYPEYHFVASAARHLSWIEERYPELFERIRDKAAAGRFVPVGGMWVESDCNVPSGESLVRQVVMGKRWFASRFGVDCTELWLPDAFGYTAALPQIMAAAGVTWFVSQKLSWNDTNRFPHHTFWWEGLDGTRVRAHFPPADTYNGEVSAQELCRGVRNSAGEAAGGRSLYPFGYGDGGGGPTREMLEAARRSADLAGLPRVAMEGPAAFFADVEADPAPLPVWRGDLYLEKHRATFTSQAKIKAGNRRSEAALSAAELWSAMAGTDAADLDAAWRMLLTNQFHDILPGSCIRWVAEQAEAELAEVVGRAAAVSERAIDAIAATVDTSSAHHPVVVFNPTPFTRREVIEVAGRPVMVEAPGLGYALNDGDAAPPDDPATAEEGEDGGFRLRNAHLDATFTADGRLTSLVDLDTHRQVVAPGATGNTFVLHDDRPRSWDAWDVDREYFDSARPLDGTGDDTPEAGEVLRPGGLRAELRFRRRFSRSSIGLVVRLDAGSRRIDFVTEVDWAEDHKFLKVAFPVDVLADRARFEVQFGHLSRPTHENTDFERARFEVCAQRFADLSEAGFGVALLNDSKYGYDVRGNVLRLSLLRAPTAPDPLCDRGRHRFTYSVLPHRGDLSPAIAAGYALNAPLEWRRPTRAARRDGRLDAVPVTHQFVSVDDPGFVVETVKYAYDGEGFVVRGYESLGGRRKVRIHLGGPVGGAAFRANRCDLLERDENPTLPVENGAVTIDIRPFEIVTLRVR